MTLNDIKHLAGYIGIESCCYLFACGFSYWWLESADVTLSISSIPSVVFMYKDRIPLQLDNSQISFNILRSVRTLLFPAIVIVLLVPIFIIQ
jgi:hypothetical protein